MPDHGDPGAPEHVVVRVPRLDQAGLAVDAVRRLEGIKAVDPALPFLPEWVPLPSRAPLAGEAAVEGQEKAKCIGEMQRLSHGYREGKR